ncbi:bifunctional 2-keto-4-hydroxyglutarate aldolase/2-keto-3-deoxy-6-phosphogluconate aldolase [Terrihalobacillus insolitus]|uniref:bifunctional 2-keto-4-hydroxyglutarate aldolase/2-keto-3-deoxy-6-phosphogluconate aldolase n=1 Tax=Terrihalobacillus insolitus TaxID=2950438 RepID=UPI002341C662|nr:bifunctional 2-keto-4-hydroxyglutarate aldolase/2-keto-3-deoxy-6-phosphogluconate aldolase [Terrihalobacillus insolitus]MDC3415150.1 bifunctional 2-keto-4-hydroxyglutarate aldolase/2-keto-3-deoxy-6-phosphogluconate aldolase [Terrihalobacillus insolitus]
MNNKYDVLNKIRNNRIIFIIRDGELENIQKIIDAGISAGLRTIELTMTSPGVLHIIDQLKNKYKGIDNLVIGIGTVMDDVTARMALTSGADFIVSPHFEEAIVRICNRYNVPVIPGAMTVTEINRAMESGAEVIKLFPARILGPTHITDIKGPIPNANFIPTGGINITNLLDWFEKGAFAVGVGGAIYKEAVATGDISLIEQKAKEYLNLVESIS